MSRRIIGHIDGKPVWSDNDGGARGRMTGSGDGLAQRGYALVGGSLVQPSEPNDKSAARYRETHKEVLAERQRAYRARKRAA